MKFLHILQLFLVWETGGSMKAELLAPAGSYEGLKAAIHAGADAVYVGGEKFGARAFANNLTVEELLAAIAYCHIRGRKLYLTLNTLLKEEEISGLGAYVEPLYMAGLDAVIVQDIGVLSYLRRQFPDLAIHASTQMTLTGTLGIQFLERQGVSRIVTARELSLDEIKQIHGETTVEIESFIHGALCYCYSGQCLYSSLIGGRSGNRGRCAQPCRMPYEIDGKKGYWLSPKDICTLEILPEIIEAGVFSLKIEGRMKRAEYAAGVVHIYRKYLDHYLVHGKKGYTVLAEDKQMLMELYNRGGFTTGYYERYNGKEMISVERANHYGIEAAEVVAVKQKSIGLMALKNMNPLDVLEHETLNEAVKKGETFWLKRTVKQHWQVGQIVHQTRNQQLLTQFRNAYIEDEIKEKINGKLRIVSGKPAILAVFRGDIKIQVVGEIPAAAKKQPLSEETLRKQIQKTGNTAFSFETLEIDLEDGLFLSIQGLNELRRKALEELSKTILVQSQREYCVVEEPKQIQTIGSTQTIEQIQTIESTQVIEPTTQTSQSDNHILTVSLESIEILEDLLLIPEIKRVYIESSSLQIPFDQEQLVAYIRRCHQFEKECYYTMPTIFRAATKKCFETQEVLAGLLLFDGIMIKNYEEWQFFLMLGWDKALVLDHNIYTFNQHAKHFARQFTKKYAMQSTKQQIIQYEKQDKKQYAKQSDMQTQILHNTAPVELNYYELQRRGCQDSELMVYGYLPMMTTAQCLSKELGHCQKKKRIMWLTDRKGKRFPVKNNCDLCYNTIYNQVPLHLLDQKEQIDRLAPRAIRLSFTIETATEAVRIAKAYAAVFSQMTKEDYSGEPVLSEFTRGHFCRGIE